MMNDDNRKAIEALQEVAIAGIREQRSWRRWNLLFRGLSLVLMLVLIAVIFSDTAGTSARMTTAKKYTALVDIKGIIMDGAEASADNIIPALRDAFEDKKASGIILRCNSPGGSPVQASYIYNEIRRLKELHENKPVYAVASDLCASGGYFIIAAADEIYVNESSLVGSIGVRMEAFGVVEAMNKLGVENRRITAGEHKAILDPFSPADPEETAFLKEMLATTHQHFINAVKAGRGERLKQDPKIFSGLFWTGKDAKELGLVDGYGSSAYVARELIKAEEIVNYTPKKDFLQRLSDRVGASLANLMLKARMDQLLFY